QHLPVARRIVPYVLQRLVPLPIIADEPPGRQGPSHVAMIIVELQVEQVEPALSKENVQFGKRWLAPENRIPPELGLDAEDALVAKRGLAAAQHIQLGSLNVDF